jgi:hypothetical protein
LNEFLSYFKEIVMKLCMHANRFEMQAGQTLELRDGKGTHIEVLSGELWVTQQGDRRDPVISAGGEFAIGHDGLTLLHAFRQSLVHVQEPAGTRTRAAGSWKRSVLGLLRSFGELGMKRSAWRNAYRI